MVMELKIKKLIKKRVVASVIFFISSILALLFILLFVWSNYKIINFQNISWMVIMSAAFIILLVNGFSNLKDKEQEVIVEDVLSYKILYTDEELKSKAINLSDDIIIENGNE